MVHDNEVHLCRRQIPIVSHRDLAIRDQFVPDVSFQVETFQGRADRDIPGQYNFAALVFRVIANLDFAIPPAFRLDTEPPVSYRTFERFGLMVTDVERPAHHKIGQFENQKDRGFDFHGDILTFGLISEHQKGDTMHTCYQRIGYAPAGVMG